MAEGIDREFLEKLNTGKYVCRPDVEILLHGDPFPSGKEDGHKHEEKTDLQQKVKDIYFLYAQEHRWPIISTGVSKKEEEIHEEVWDIVRPYIL